MRIQQIEDLEDAKELWKDFQDLHQIVDHWPGDDHTYWKVVDAKGAPIGLTSAVYRPAKGYVYLSYAIVSPFCKDRGVQRRLIRHRLRWAKRQGAVYVTTYTILHNYPSIMNLLKCGFKFAPTARGWPGAGRDVHYFEKQL